MWAHPPAPNLIHIKRTFHSVPESVVTAHDVGQVFLGFSEGVAAVVAVGTVASVAVAVASVVRRVAWHRVVAAWGAAAVALLLVWVGAGTGAVHRLVGAGARAVGWLVGALAGAWASVRWMLVGVGAGAGAVHRLSGA